MKIRFEGYSLNDLETIKEKHRLTSHSDAARYAAAKMADEIKGNDNKGIKVSKFGVAAMVQSKKDDK